MAAFNLEQAVCTGRGFDAAGLLGKFRTWITKAPLAGGGGGPGWFEQDASQVAAGTDPYLVVSDKNAAGPNVPAKYVQVLLPSATSGQIRVFFYLYWNPTTHKGYGLYGAHDIPTLDASDFIYDFRGGPECLLIQTFTTTTWDGAFIDEITMDSNLIDSVSATTSVANFVDNGTPQIRGISISAGSVANLVDANRKYYVNVVLVSGSTYRIDVFKSSARDAGNLVAQTSNFTGLTAGTAGSQTANAQNSSGLTLSIEMLGVTAADATIVFMYDRINVGTGEGAQFTVGNYYFIYDFTRQCAVNSFKVISKSGDQLEIDRLYIAFPLGAKVGSYPHPYIACGTGTSLIQNPASIPYYNSGTGTATAYANGSGGSIGCEQSHINASNIPSNWGNTFPNNSPAAGASTDDGYLGRMSPDRKGRYAVQRPGLFEVKSFGWGNNITPTDGKTGYGQPKNFILGVTGSMSVNIHGRRLNNIDYTYFRAGASYIPLTVAYALMFRETQSDS